MNVKIYSNIGGNKTWLIKRCRQTDDSHTHEVWERTLSYQNWKDHQLPQLMQFWILFYSLWKHFSSKIFIIASVEKLSKHYQGILYHTWCSGVWHRFLWKSYITNQIWIPVNELESWPHISLLWHFEISGEKLSQSFIRYMINFLFILSWMKCYKNLTSLKSQQLSLKETNVITI